MLTRAAIVVFVATAAAGCANDAPTLSGFASTASLAIAPAAQAQSVADGSDQTYRKTMSDRVLTAIALERVTGLKPDPSRLSE